MTRIVNSMMWKAVHEVVWKAARAAAARVAVGGWEGS